MKGVQNRECRKTTNYQQQTIPHNAGSRLGRDKLNHILCCCPSRASELGFYQGFRQDKGVATL